MDQAAASGRVPVPEATVVFTVKVSARLAAAVREHAAQRGHDVPKEWVFEDEGHSGATLVRPALEALRDLVARGCVDVVLVYSPDRLAWSSPG